MSTDKGITFNKTSGRSSRATGVRIMPPTCPALIVNGGDGVEILAGLVAGDTIVRFETQP